MVLLSERHTKQNRVDKTRLLELKGREGGRRRRDKRKFESHTFSFSFTGQRGAAGHVELQPLSAVTVVAFQAS